jgi:SAM-dependent methyltransferase
MSKIEELRDLIKKYEGRGDCFYTPIVIDGEVFHEAKSRKHENQFRFDYIDVKDKTVCDLGCNNGYSSFLFAERGAKKVLAIERDLDIGEILELVADIKNLPNVETYIGMYQEYFTKNKNEVFDVAVFTSEQDYNGVLIILSCLIGEQTYKINAKAWYIEPTNHPDHKLSKEEIKEWGERELGKYGDVEFLTHTDYQNRGLFKLEIKDELYK